jgi:hypothetical protein
VRFTFQTQAIVPKDSGGTCDSNCFDAHGADVVLTGAWKKYELAWTDLKQAGWGTAAAFDKTKTRNLQWEFLPGAFDLQLDDIRFTSP